MCPETPAGKSGAGTAELTEIYRQVPPLWPQPGGESSDLRVCLKDQGFTPLTKIFLNNDNPHLLTDCFSHSSETS